MIDDDRKLCRLVATYLEPLGFDVSPVHTGPEGVERATADDAALLLTPVEFDLLASLAKARGRVKSREALLDEIRDRDYDVFDRSIDVHISSLRKKLKDDAKNPRFIRTFRSAGYMLVAPDS
jgi:DNA-binding response OmpR family regulator